MAELIEPQVFHKQTRSVWKPRTLLPGLPEMALLWLPALLVAAAMLLPIIYLLLRAGGADLPAWQWLLRTRTLEILGRTILLVIGVTSAAMVVAVPLAWLTVRTDLPLGRLWSILIPLPLVIPSYVGAYLFVSALGPRGILQSWLEAWFGVTRLPDIHGLPGAVIVLTLISYPYIYLSVRAALLKMDPTLEEAARSLGHNLLKTFRRVTLPQLRPAITVGSLLVALYVLRDFGAVSILRYDTFSRVIYIQYRSSFDRASAAALSLILVAMTVVILVLEIRTRGRSLYHSASATASRPLARFSLGAWRWPALIFCAGVTGLALLVPAGLLLYWLVRGILAGEQISNLWLATRNSALASVLAAGFSLLAALPVAVLNVRRPGRLSHLLERVTYVGYALPGIVIALALVFFGANYALSLYQTLPLLIFAYVVLFLPQAVGALRASILQVQPSLEEAGRSLGHGPLRIFQKITLPLISPGVAAGAGLVFLTTMKELPATLILAPIGFKTLASGLWSAVSEAFFAKAAAPALLLILVSSLPMAILIIKDQNKASSQ